MYVCIHACMYVCMYEMCLLQSHECVTILYCEYLFVYIHIHTHIYMYVCMRCAYSSHMSA